MTTMTDEELQAKIDALPHPKVTRESIEAKIVGVDYLKLPDSTWTICSITMRNGFSVRGESACVDPRNYDVEIGKQLAYKDAFAKLWAFEGYLLCERYKPDIERIARAAHEVNRAYCAALGDDSQPAWEDAPGWQRSSAMNGVLMHLGNPDATPEDSHESWLAQKRAEGWGYGPVKDPEAKTHPCFLPYDELPQEQRAKDYIFRAVVHALK